MKILIVNDDSISTPGIEMLAKSAVELGETGFSNCGCYPVGTACPEVKMRL